MSRLSIIIIILLVNSLLFAQQTNLDCHYSNIGPIGIIVTNTGNIGYGMTQGKCVDALDNEYPIGSGCMYGPMGLWIGAKRGSQPYVSTSGPYWNPNVNNEIFPSAEAWDTVWVVNKGQTVDIPYWPGYTAVSHQDLVCRFNDYMIKNPPQSNPHPDEEPHTPLNVDIIQVVYVWTGLEVVVYHYYIIPKQLDLEGACAGWAGNIFASKLGSLSNDEFGWFDEVNHLGLVQDISGNSDDCETGGIIAFRMLPDVPDDQVGWNWDDNYCNNDQFVHTDLNKYNQEMAGGINHDPLQSLKYGHFYCGIGPFQVPLGDTLHFAVAQIHGKNLDAIYINLENILFIRSNGYRVPGPPPQPPLRFEVGNHLVNLHWDVQTGDVDPETYTDEARLDGETEPFEGYRLYKSTASENGPWTMLAEFDRTDDNLGDNIGLQYSFVDRGLLNNLEYYYTITAYSKPDTVLGIPSQESSKNANAILVVPGTAPPKTVGKVAVVPNPYRGDEKYYSYNPPWEKGGEQVGQWSEEFRRIQFINLPSPSEIKIYTVAGQYVTTLYHDDPQLGYHNWNLTSTVGQAVSSGLYLFSVKDVKSGDVQVGKFVIVK